MSFKIYRIIEFVIKYFRTFSYYRDENCVFNRPDHAVTGSREYGKQRGSPKSSPFATIRDRARRSRRAFRWSGRSSEKRGTFAREHTTTITTATTVRDAYKFDVRTILGNNCYAAHAHRVRYWLTVNATRTIIAINSHNYRYVSPGPRAVAAPPYSPVNDIWSAERTCTRCTVRAPARNNNDVVININYRTTRVAVRLNVFDVVFFPP